MTQHTPAPWRYEASTKTIRSVPGNYWLATVDSWDGAVNHEANALVLAAAAEMFETLVLVEKKLTESPAFNAWDLGPTRTLLAVRAAIAKAKGTP